jgi:hypothetical protein
MLPVRDGDGGSQFDMPSVSVWRLLDGVRAAGIDFGTPSVRAG